MYETGCSISVLNVPWVLFEFELLLLEISQKVLPWIPIPVAPPVTKLSLIKGESVESLDGTNVSMTPNRTPPFTNLSLIKDIESRKEVVVGVSKSFRKIYISHLEK